MWQAVAKISDIPKGSGQMLELDGLKIALFNVDGKICAISGVCPHRGGPLGDGHLEGSRVTCPWHAWEFDVKTGECLTLPGDKQKTYPTKIKDGEVWIEV